MTTLEIILVYWGISIIPLYLLLYAFVYPSNACVYEPFEFGKNEGIADSGYYFAGKHMAAVTAIFFVLVVAIHLIAAAYRIFDRFADTFRRDVQVSRPSKNGRVLSKTEALDALHGKYELRTMTPQEVVDTIKRKITEQEKAPARRRTKRDDFV